MNYGQASAIKEALEKILEKERVKETIFIRVSNGEVKLYEDAEELPEIDELKERGLLL